MNSWWQPRGMMADITDDMRQRRYNDRRMVDAAKAKGIKVTYIADDPYFHCPVCNAGYRRQYDAEIHCNMSRYMEKELERDER